MATITVGKKILGKLLTAHTRHKVPQHDHSAMHVPGSLDWLSKNFAKSKEQFKWVTNISTMRHYAPHHDVHLYRCPMCGKRHHMNPTSVISLYKH